jgi:hypothetical protein
VVTLRRKNIGGIGTSRKSGAPGRIRTSDPQIRSLVFYPTELRVHLVARGAIYKPVPDKATKNLKLMMKCLVRGGKGGIRTPDTVSRMRP